MSDNTPQQGTDTIASDDIAGVKYQRVKVSHGADGSAVDTSSTNPLPVTAVLTASSASVGTANIASIPAADYTTDSLEAYNDPRYVVVAGSRLEVQFGAIDLAASGTVVAASANEQTLVLSYDLVADAATKVRWLSAATNLSGQKNLAGPGYGVAKSHPNGVLRCGTNEGLILNLATAVTVGGELSYVKLPV